MRTLNNKIARAFFALTACMAMAFGFLACSNDSEPPVVIVVPDNQTKNGGTKTDGETNAPVATPAIYTITFNANDGSPNPATVPQNFTAGIPQALTPVEELGFSKEGFNFAGWGTAPKSKQASYADGASYTAKANATLYALWSEIPVYSVKIPVHVNGSVTATPATGSAGTEITLLATPNAGYQFGAFTVVDAANNPISVTDGKFTLPEQDVNVTVTFVANSDIDMQNVPLTLEAIEAGAKVTFENNATGYVVYCINGGVRQTIASGEGKEISLENAGDKVAFYGDNATYATGDSSFSNIACDKNCYVYGNMMSLVKSEGFASVDKLSASYTFYKFFANNSRIKNKVGAELLLPATTLSESCYGYMFYGCRVLTNAPELPAKILVPNCYSGMFGSTGLTNAPELPVKTLAIGCYQGMFKDCAKLNNVKCLATDIDAYCATNEWLSGVASKGTFKRIDGVSWPSGASGIPEGWTVIDDQSQTGRPQTVRVYSVTVPESSAHGMVVAGFGRPNMVLLCGAGGTVELRIIPESGYQLEKLIVKDTNGSSVATSGTGDVRTFVMPAKDVTVAATFVAISDSDMQNVPLTLEAIKAGAKVTFKNNAAGSVTYCINGGVRQTIDSGVSKEIALETVGDKVAFYGDNATYATGDSSFSNIACDKNCYVYGNMMSLVKSEGFASVDKLSASYTFYKFFANNSRIKNKVGAELLLPATTLAEYCYSGMFSYCGELTVAPALPATTLARGCYKDMFSWCCELILASSLPAKTLAGSCYKSMFSGCEGLGSAPALPATTLAEECYSGMFSDCRELTGAPALPATTLVRGCYKDMFSGCEGLSSAPALPAATLVRDCYSGMFSGCRELTVAPALPATTLVEYCYSGMFSGCRELTVAPTLPATTLARGCYMDMFSGCSKLNNVNCLAIDVDDANCTSRWLFRVASNGTFTKAPGVPWPVGDSGIPEGWTVNDSDQQFLYPIKMPNNVYHGTVTSSATSAASGTEITFTIKPENGYEFESLSVTDAYGNSVDISGTGNTRTFTMPASLVTVRYYFSAIKYNVNIGSSENGTVTADTTKWASGNRVKLSIRPNDGYELKELIVTASDGSSIAISGTGDSRTFTMPVQDVTVTATFAVRKYNVNIGSSENGIVTADKTKLVSRELVILTIRPENGYELKELIVRASDGSSVYISGADDSRTFWMPAKDVTVTATFSAIKYYAVNIGSFEHGTVTADKTSAASGTTIALTIKPESGCELETLIVKDINGYSVGASKNGNTITFTMPAKDVTVTATFIVKYSVNIGAFENGTVTAEKTKWASGEYVKLTINPANGYGLGTLFVTAADGSSVVISGTEDTITFTMPAQDVTVTATFVVKYSVNIGTFENGTVTANKTKASGGEYIKLTANPASGYKLGKIIVTAADGTPVEMTDSGSTRYFYMPENDVTVDAQFIDKYSRIITIRSTVNGTVKADKTSAASGTTVTLDISPASGYELAGIALKYLGSSCIALNGAGNSKSFIMPDKDVEIVAAFSKVVSSLGSQPKYAKDAVDKSVWDLSKLDTARNVSYMYEIEKDVILEMNMARTNPKKYAELYIAPRLNNFSGNDYIDKNNKKIATSEGKRVVNECIEYMNSRSALSVLQPSRGLTKASKDHSLDQAQTSQTGHTGGDGSSTDDRMKRYGSYSKEAGENIDYGSSYVYAASARDIVVALLIDDGVSSRGHRKNIMNEKFATAGVGYADYHGKYNHVCVIDYAQIYEEKQ